ncbi:MAG: GerW family sporulation protein [Oscillospiraceae bacterium]|jgi:sporulation protein YtfJ|nr:GerW family sporulation protein [Oscillospiraceae bacterium]
MADHPIEGMMDTTLEKIKQMVDVNSVIGDPITSPDGTVIVPISKVSYGFASGGSDFSGKVPDKQLFGGATGAGVTINPVAFLTIANGTVKLLRVDPGNTSMDRIIDMAPDLIDKVSAAVGSAFHKPAKKETEQSASIPAEEAAGDPQI